MCQVLQPSFPWLDEIMFKVGYPTTKYLRCRENPLQESAKKDHGKLDQGFAD
jgi:hypothetical protein